MWCNSNHHFLFIALLASSTAALSAFLKCEAFHLPGVLPPPYHSNRYHYHSRVQISVPCIRASSLSLHVSLLDNNHGNDRCGSRECGSQNANEHNYGRIVNKHICGVNGFDTSSMISCLGDFCKEARSESARVGLFSAALFASVLFAPIGIHMEMTHTKSSSILPLPVPVPTSMNAWAITENQQFVSDVWWAVTAQFFDPTFNGLTEDGWRAQKAEAVLQVSDTGPDDEREVAAAIQSMLSKLGDPYTRFLPREKYESLTTYARGGSAGIGVQLLSDPRSSGAAVIVANVSGDGPAEKMGMRQGDMILEIDGERLEGGGGVAATAELVAAKCRGEAGTEVNILVRHVDSESKSEERLSITRANIKVNPVRASTYITSNGERTIGLLAIPAFSQETPGQVIDALRSVKSDDAQVIVIDLRGNVGGYMPAGIDTAKLFLAGRNTIVAEVNRSGQRTAYYADGIGADTTTPLYLLVDGRTASAAEIFGAALQDNRRASLVGSKTFGKGRIQNLQSVGSGSGVAVTRARYVTPKGTDLHGVGITPNKETDCKPEDSAVMCMENIV